MLASRTKENAVDRDQTKLDQRQRDRVRTPGKDVFSGVVAHSRAAVPEQTEPTVARHRPADGEAVVASWVFAFAVEMRLQLLRQLNNEPRERGVGMRGIDGRVAYAVEMLVC